MNEDELHCLREGERAGELYLLKVPNRLQRGSVGMQTGEGAGSSLEFLDHREYQPGDDIRHIDWQALARSDRLTIKLFRNEIAPHVDILFDASLSMALENTQKKRALLGLTALLAKAAENSSFTCLPWKIGAYCEKVSNGHLSPSLWSGISIDYPGDAGAVLANLPPTLQPHSLRILISDLLWQIDPQSLLSSFVQQAAAVLIIQLLSLDELHPSVYGNVRFIDTETMCEKEMFIDQEALDEYTKRLARHQNNWMSACRTVGAAFVSFVAEKFVETWKPLPIIEKQFLAVL